MEKSLIIIPPETERYLRLEYEVKLWDGTTHEIPEKMYLDIGNNKIPGDAIFSGNGFFFKKSAVSSAKKIKDYETEKAAYIRDLKVIKNDMEIRKIQEEKEKIEKELSKKREEWIKENPEEFEKIVDECKKTIRLENKETSIFYERAEKLARMFAKSKVPVC